MKSQQFSIYESVHCTTTLFFFIDIINAVIEQIASEPNIIDQFIDLSVIP